MKKTPGRFKKNKLRKQAEKLLAEKPVRVTAKPKDINKLFHELQVYQIELEMQNEELLAAQTQASETLERFTQLYDYAPSGYLTLDKNGVVKEINLTGASMLGKPRQFLIGYSLVTLLPCRKLFRDYLKEVCRTRFNVSIELQIMHADGKLLDVQLESRRISNGDEDDCFIHTIMTDISRRKALERTLQQQRSNMEHLLQQQVAAQTASAIAHDLNQPLNAISVYSEVAVRYLNSGFENTDQLKRALMGCIDQAHRAGQSLHELLDFLHKGELIFEPVDLNLLVEEAVMVESNDGFSGFQPELELDDSLPLVLCSQIQVKKVLVNLLRNSVEAVRESGQSNASIIIKVRTWADSNRAQVTIQDNGTGMDAETIKHIFDPFFTTKPTGIGLGLVISRSLIEANGGQLWVESDAGPGAKFHLSLPFAHM
ncbi:ATP-binding protein [Methylicorpusculum oleiharenae]|uniref:two-component system sensor histidine kinase NtrB n=1 Tax=Methylicorpusculum oleiharenae TaxID=1338687 RepID=UPI0013595F97|nr:ATP-binding protein [Methylicorpusculum oleiharenae]MCD2452488.1 ATP-binding protein [Methylicorpusculum oleiharenae]